VKVLLISLKAGGVALNLTVASRIFLMGKILNSVWLVLL
jgi:SNF2 family DNA or RNA helicase